MLGVILENFTLGFFPKIFLGVTIHVGKSGKRLGQKVKEIFFMVDQGKKNQNV